VLTALTALCFAAGAVGQLQLDPPGEREFIADRANIIDADDATRIKLICDQLLTENATPIIVVTVNRMADHARGMGTLRIESFATLLFNQWQIGHPELNGQNWNTGILLVVSRGDRKARIELGAGWENAMDLECRRIMDERIIPEFKAGRYSTGIRNAVEALDLMARGKPLPRRPIRFGAILPWLLFFGLAAFTVVSLIRRGSGGWAWFMWAAGFALVGTLLYHLSQSRSSGSFGGGSFGGGFSGGGGASGSW
jgi:uncharacterized protein